MSPSGATALTTRDITTWRSTRGRWGRGGPDSSRPPRSPSLTSGGWGRPQQVRFLTSFIQSNKLSTFFSCRQPQTATQSIRGGSGSFPKSEPVIAEISSRDPSATSTHHGVHTAPPLNLPLVWHVSQGLPREIHRDFASTPGIRSPLNKLWLLLLPSSAILSSHSN